MDSISRVTGTSYQPVSSTPVSKGKEEEQIPDPIEVGPATPGGPVSAYYEEYYDPVKKEFIKPYPDYNKDSYNCHSFGWHDSEGDPKDPRNFPQWIRWDNYPDDNITPKGYVRRAPGEKSDVGDKVIYWQDDNADGKIDADEIIHSAIVTKVDENGNATQFISKWGEEAKYLHHPLAVPDIYGKNWSYFKKVNNFDEQKTLFTDDELKTMELTGKKGTIDKANQWKYLSTVESLEKAVKKGIV